VQIPSGHPVSSPHDVQQPLKQCPPSEQNPSRHGGLLPHGFVTQQPLTHFCPGAQSSGNGQGVAHSQGCPLHPKNFAICPAVKSQKSSAKNRSPAATAPQMMVPMTSAVAPTGAPIPESTNIAASTVKPASQSTNTFPALNIPFFPRVSLHNCLKDCCVAPMFRMSSGVQQG
jgi:hypothetical protein